MQDSTGTAPNVDFCGAVAINDLFTILADLVALPLTMEKLADAARYRTHKGVSPRQFTPPPRRCCGTCNQKLHRLFKALDLSTFHPRRGFS